MIEASTENYDKLKKKYNEYLELYRFFNGGSLQGACDFAEYYWRFTYNIVYQDNAKMGMGNG